MKVLPLAEFVILCYLSAIVKVLLLKNPYLTGHTKHLLGCLKNTKSLKSQAPQGFSGCLDIDNDEMNKKKFFLSASPRVNQTLRSTSV